MDHLLTDICVACLYAFLVCINPTGLTAVVSVVLAALVIARVLGKSWRGIMVVEGIIVVALLIACGIGYIFLVWSFRNWTF